MKQLLHTVQKDERKKETRREEETFVITIPQWSRKSNNGDRVSSHENLRSNRTFKKGYSPFFVPGLDSLRFTPKSFVTAGIALGAKTYFLENDQEEMKIDYEIEENIFNICSNHPDFTGKKDKHPVKTIGMCQDFLLNIFRNKGISVKIENVSSREDDINIVASKEISVNTEHCIVPLKSLEWISQHKPKLANLMYSMLKEFDSVCDVIRINSDWIPGTEEIVQEKLWEYESMEEDLNPEDKEYLEELRVAIALYSDGGTIDRFEKKINNSKGTFSSKLKRFKPKDPVEELYYDWIKKAERILQIKRPIRDYDFALLGENDYTPVMPSMCMRFVWSEFDTVYREFYNMMQMSFQEGGVMSPVIHGDVEDFFDRDTSEEEEFLKLFSNFMQEGKDTYYQFLELMNIKDE